MTTWRAWAALVLLAGTVRMADAQVPALERERGFVNVSFGAGLVKKTDDSAFVFPLFDEEARVGVTRSVAGGPFPDVTGGLWLTRKLGLAVSFNRFSNKANGSVDAQIPDPAFYDTLHAVTGSADGLTHEESWISVLIAFPLRSVSGFDFTLLVGPSLARVTHEVASDVAVPSTSSVALTLEQRTRDLVGGQVGVDVRRMMNRRFGVGFYARYSSAKGHLGAYHADLGGLQVGGGARVRF